MEPTPNPVSVVEPAGAPVRAEVPSRVCLISIAGGLYAIDLRNVREVFAVEAVTPVPGMGTVLAGVTNLRGVIIPLVDLRTILDLSSTAPSAFAVVIRHGEHQVGVAGNHDCPAGPIFAGSSEWIERGASLRDSGAPHRRSARWCLGSANASGTRGDRRLGLDHLEDIDSPTVD